MLKGEFEYYGFSQQVIQQYFIDDIVLKRRTQIEGLKEPHFVTFDEKSEKIWVTDCSEKLVSRYNLLGEKEESYTDNSPSRSVPQGIVCDSRGRIIICHDGFGMNGKRLLVMQTGTVDTYIQAQYKKSFNKPKSLAVDDQDNIYLADGTNGRVLVYTPDGKKNKEIGQYGFNSGDFNFSWGIATGSIDKWLYVSDLNHRCIHVFDLKTGKFLFTIGLNEDEEPILTAPTGLCVTSHGHLLVCDNGKNTVEVFHAYTGLHIKTIDFELSHPVGICISPDQRFVAVTECYDDKQGSVIVLDVSFCDFPQE